MEIPPQKEFNKISKRKPSFPIRDGLREYLEKFQRQISVSLTYQDMLRFQNSIPLLDDKGKDTLWISVTYNEFELKELTDGIKEIYTFLKSDGNKEYREHLSVDRIDYCTFGNSNPFRVRIVNLLNDNHDYMYVKKADASRVYGLELEHILSPNRINFIVDGATLIEEHISGIPGDVFIEEYLPVEQEGYVRLAKEFVKFNERCIIRLLGDMRSYNYVIIRTHDIDQIQYRLRAIDFDQQSFEGRLSMYKPQLFVENTKFVEMVIEKLPEKAILQYQHEERSLIARRIKSSHYRLTQLLDLMQEDSISSPEKVSQLKQELYEYVKDVNFNQYKTMGGLLRAALTYVLKRYEDAKLSI